MSLKIDASPDLDVTVVLDTNDVKILHLNAARKYPEVRGSQWDDDGRGVNLYFSYKSALRVSLDDDGWIDACASFGKYEMILTLFRRRLLEEALR